MTFPGIVLVSTPLAPPYSPPDPGRQLLQQRWIDGKGATWSLTNEGSGLILMRGVRGLGMPAYTHFRDKHASMDGENHRGVRAEAREVFWPIYLFHDGDSIDWVERNRAFWRGLSPRTEGRWVVQGPDGSERSLRLRYEKGGEDAFEMDPAFFGWAKYGLYLKADQPYWEGEPIVRTWRTTEPVFFFGPDRLAPAFHISPPPTAEQATLTNPGDVPAWPVWTLTGPLEATTKVGVAGRTVELGFAVPAGQDLVIDTRPHAQTAILNGVDRTSDLATYGFAEIPAGKNVPIEVTLIAPAAAIGAAKVELVPLYEWAF